MADTEKKIAEIREALEFNGEWWGNVVEGEPICQDEIDEVNGLIEANRFLLSELDRIQQEYAEERAAHNAHVTELCELEQERNMYKASSEVFYERLKKAWEEREALIECLRFYERLARGREINDGGRRARTLLAEIGVTVEW